MEIPDRPNFYSTLHTTLSRSHLAELYRALGWQVRKCSFHDYEVTCEWAELVIEADSPVLMHGAVSNVTSHAEEIVAPLRTARVAFIAECYGPEPSRELLFEMRSE